MTYLLTFLLIVCLFYLIKKQLKIKKQKRIILQYELRKERLNSIINQITLYPDLDSQIEALYHILQTQQDNETNRQNTPSVR